MSTKAVFDYRIRIRFYTETSFRFVNRMDFSAEFETGFYMDPVNEIPRK